MENDWWWGAIFSRVFGTGDFCTETEKMRKGEPREDLGTEII